LPDRSFLQDLTFRGSPDPFGRAAIVAGSGPLEKPQGPQICPRAFRASTWKNR